MRIVPGADEFGFSTAPLIVLGCTMMRKCHLNTCPVGIATQDPVLRKKFQGQPEHLINYLFLLAEDIRQEMAKLGVSKFQDLIGRTDLLRVRESDHPKAHLLNFGQLLRNALHMRPGVNIVGGSIPQDFGLDEHLDRFLLEQAAPVLEGKRSSVDIRTDITNSNRAVGSTLSYYIAKKHGDDGLPAGSIKIRMTGSAGQSFCAFLAGGCRVELEGDANDYVAKGLSGGQVSFLHSVHGDDKRWRRLDFEFWLYLMFQVIIYPPKTSPFNSEDNVIVGNACLYGATSGRALIRGVAAERFCVRNSGATAVVEGVGDHGCEYMTGGVVLILGSTGRNFAAGMSGGVAYVYDTAGSLSTRCNTAMVELVPLKEAEDLQLVKTLLTEFAEATESRVARTVLEQWPQEATKFIKVFPYEYQKALTKLKPQPQPVKSAQENHVIQDIEDVVQNGDRKQLDKTRGFMKYERERHVYRAAEKRMKDWDEIYHFDSVRRGLRVQAARCMDCGVPFCQSSYGCPLGNIIPKWNELVFQNKWKDALDQLLQTK